MSTAFTIKPGRLQLGELRRLCDSFHHLSLEPGALDAIEASEQLVAKALTLDKPLYGINTGFGKLADKNISPSQLSQLQHNLVLSHAAGVGEPLDKDVVRTVLLLKINSLAQGLSGVRLSLIERLLNLHNAEAYPIIPSQGSVGASGDLAPLAHLAAALLGHGEVNYNDAVYPAEKVLTRLGLSPLTLAAKEGLALLNGLQVSSALGLHAYFKLEKTFAAAIVAGALSVDAALGSSQPFDARLNDLRELDSQEQCAAMYRQLLDGSQIRQALGERTRVQDPYSLRCQPQVMGACLSQIRFAIGHYSREANTVSDNPLVFSQDEVILSGGNFHGAAISFAADNMALAIAEIGNLAERRIALVNDSSISGLPPFVSVDEPGEYSGFMIAHVTAAALASENKQLAAPASIDSLPTSANQEDHVSMATHAAQRLHRMIANLNRIIAIELLCACQGVELRAPLQTSTTLQQVMELLREEVGAYHDERVLGPDIEKVAALVSAGEFLPFVPAVATTVIPS